MKIKIAMRKNIKFYPRYKQYADVASFYDNFGWFRLAWQLGYQLVKECQ